MTARQVRRAVSILEDEQIHGEFFERSEKVLEGGGLAAEGARDSAKAWWRRLPPTVDRYLEGEALGHSGRASTADLGGYSRVLA